jgi:hypothetical protein
MKKFVVAVYWGKMNEAGVPDSIMSVKAVDRNSVFEIVDKYITTFNSGIPVRYQINIIGEIDVEI